MGYTTDFEGRIAIDPPLSAEEVAYLKAFSDTRRMDREKGPYFVDGSGFMSQGHDDDVIDHNTPPAGQPGLWCQWEPTEDGDGIEWDGAEKFYRSAEWMDYLIQHFLKPDNISGTLAEWGGENHPFTGHMLNGTIAAQGEDPSDMWLLHVKDNVVFVEELVAAPGGSLTQITKQNLLPKGLKQIGRQVMNTKLHEALKESTFIVMDDINYRVTVYEVDEMELLFEHEDSGEQHSMTLAELDTCPTLQVYTLTEVNFRDGE